ncbi:MAG: hypothetical protein Q9162_003386 [Coniocarpon cinnabarinum]
MASTFGAPLRIQREVVDERRSLSETSAGEALIRRMQEMEERHQADNERRDAEFIQVREELVSVKKALSVTPDKSAQLQGNLLGFDAPMYARMNVDDLLADDPPPPYTPMAASKAKTFLTSVVHLILFSLEPLRVVSGIAIPYAMRQLRPRLQKDSSRIEWNCDCGDVLYGDFIGKTPGSLQDLAAELNGRITSGPAAQGTTSAGSGSQQQSLASTETTVPGAPGSCSHSLDPGETSAAPVWPRIGPGPANNTQDHLRTMAPKWLELCLLSGPNTFSLGEIDVSGPQTDKSVFDKIRVKYSSERVMARIFARLAFRVPVGGVFVQSPYKFRKDENASMSNPIATASIMQRPSFPTPKQARDFNYTFKPSPMDEPPMPSPIFNHYFQHPRPTHNTAKWIKRFPQLLDTSLFYNNEELAKGWGIEIIEDRNWLLLICANIIALLIGGATATIYAVCTKDVQTGVAIGTWLCAAQTLTLNALLWRWTDV